MLNEFGQHPIEIQDAIREWLLENLMKVLDSNELDIHNKVMKPLFEKALQSLINDIVMHICDIKEGEKIND